MTIWVEVNTDQQGQRSQEGRSPGRVAAFPPAHMRVSMCKENGNELSTQVGLYSGAPCFRCCVD